MLQYSIADVERSLWEAADQLRANSKLTAAEYVMPVLGIIFLRFAHNKFVAVEKEIVASRPVVKGRAPLPISEDDFTARKAIFLPDIARYDFLVSLPSGKNIGRAVNDAMRAIEEKYTALKGVLPKNYDALQDSLLRDLLRNFDSEAIRSIQGDAFGKIYEYFLNAFATTGAQEGGEFFTPESLVKTIVNVLQPDHGKILDPACGSAGMFVQTGHFIERRGLDPSQRITIYGQEKTTVNTQIAKMNLWVHGLEGEIVEANSFYEERFSLAGKCDFVMANPPFNVDLVDKGSDFVKSDPRLLVGKDAAGNEFRLLPKNDNANYLWIQYFYGYLNENGRAGFVMASSASDAGHTEKDIRKMIINTGAVDVMIAIGTNFFYTRSLPCTLWFFDRAKERDAIKKDRTLMLDARGIFRVVTRKINDFSPEQLQNITAIVELYRGNNTLFVETVSGYFDEFVDAMSKFDVNHTQVFESAESLANTVERIAPVLGGEAKVLLKKTSDESKKLLGTLEKKRAELKAVGSTAGLSVSKISKTQHTAYESAHAALDVVKSLRDSAELLCKGVTEFAERAIAETEKPAVKSGDVKKMIKDLEKLKAESATFVKRAGYMLHQVKWLQSRFPDAEFVDVPGLCKVVSKKEIAENDYSLTPGRYVGVAPKEDDGVDFVERMTQIKVELQQLNNEAVELAEQISKNFEALGL